ncbi:MAG: ABC transporter substrate-binding protein [Truepera sp.]|jgi:glucose/mannose transport system substrate-binding protein|nr:ABC transporter substrate-binding protein [Truepera sp.]HRN19744.1 ABC transporter substrate-binding protein [Trueperaceae bacterium]
MRKALVLLATLVLSAAFAQNSVEIFSWWAGDEGPALEALIKQYETDHPGVEVINATVTGGSGVNARAVLKTRMLGGDPPDSFQVHAGQELIGTWVVADRMEDLTSLFKEQGWLTAFPQGLLDLISTDKGIWSVPVNIHRSNVLWYVPANLEKWGVTVPADWNEFVTTTCPALRTAGVTPLVIGENWTVQHLWESVAVAEMGPDGWRGLWDGSVAFDSPEAQAVWETFDKVLACTNADFTGLSWQQATDRVANGQAAFNVMGDWAAGYMATTLGLEPGTGFAWAASPGTDGVFILLADSFGLPKGAPDRDNALAWLELVGSKKGQDIFNPLKGSISPRLDSDLSKYNAYGKSAAADYQSDTQVGSLVHGAVANETFMSDFATVMETFLSNRDAAEAASLAAELAGRAHIGN